MAPDSTDGLTMTMDEGCAPSPLSALSGRDRFLDLAFCWAELLFEFDSAGNVVFAAGTVEALTGHDTSELLGRSIASLIVQDDRMVLDALLNIARDCSRTQDVAVRLIGKWGPSRPMVVGGYRPAGLDGHFFLGFRRPSVLRPEAGSKPLLRDRGSGLYDADSLANVVAGHLARDRLAGHRMTLFAAEGAPGLGARIARGADPELLAAIGSVLRANAFDGDTAGRLAWNRFGLVHEATLDVVKLERRLAEAIEHATGERTGVAIHVGTIDIDDDWLDDHDVAKALVYTINRFRYLDLADPPVEDLSASIARLAKEAVEAVTAFRRAISGDDFDVVFQPILEVSTGAIHHYEALARFRTNGGSRTPYEQITFAEETGLIADFDLAMARKVIRWLGQVRHTARVAINISGASIGSLSYLSELDSLLNENPWARGRLMFEITESARMEQLGQANVFIQRLRQDGYPVCLDDFGAGAANFEYLSRLEVDIIKLDGTAIRQARRGPKGQAFLKALVSLCRELNVATIAEMVEDRPALDFVRQCGVQFVQGHLFGQPTEDIGMFADAIPSRLFR